MHAACTADLLLQPAARIRRRLAAGFRHLPAERAQQLGRELGVLERRDDVGIVGAQGPIGGEPVERSRRALEAAASDDGAPSAARIESVAARRTACSSSSAIAPSAATQTVSANCLRVAIGKRVEHPHAAARPRGRLRQRAARDGDDEDLFRHCYFAGPGYRQFTGCNRISQDLTGCQSEDELGRRLKLRFPAQLLLTSRDKSRPRGRTWATQPLLDPRLREDDSWRNQRFPIAGFPHARPALILSITEKSC